MARLARPRRAAAWVCCLIGLFAIRCGEDFTPVSVLEDLRVLGLRADPLELGPTESVRIEPLEFVPSEAGALTRAWRFCPVHFGAAAAFECIDPACEVALEPEPDGAVVATPGALFVRHCVPVLAAASGGGGGAGGDTSIPAEVETLFRYRVEQADGFGRDAVARVIVHTGSEPPDDERNRPPRIAVVAVRGEVLAPGARLGPFPRDAEVAIDLEVDRERLDDYVDGLGRAQTEAPFASWYTTAGRYERDRTDDPDLGNLWRAEELDDDGPSEAEIWVVLRDGRGGVDWAGPFFFAIAP